MKEKLDENSDCEPYELCNTVSSKEDFCEVSKLSLNMKNGNNLNILDKNIVNINGDNQRINNDDTIYCLRESLEDKSNKCNDNENNSLNKNINVIKIDRLSKTFYKDNKTEYFKSRQI